MRRGGFTLVELVLALLILAAMAGAMLPLSSRGYDAERIDLASSALASALRFARSEAIRTGSERGVAFDYLADRATVFQPDLSGGSIVVASVLTDPFTRHPYLLELADLPGVRGVDLDGFSSALIFAGTFGSKIRVLFDEMGLPVYVSLGSRHLLSSGTLTLRYRSLERQVRLWPNGRVTVQ